MHDHEPICISLKEFPAIIMYANSRAKGSSSGFSTVCCMGLLLTNIVQFDQETGTSLFHKMQHAAVQHHKCLFLLVKQVCLTPPDGMHMTWFEVLHRVVRRCYKCKYQLQPETACPTWTSRMQTRHSSSCPAFLGSTILPQRLLATSKPTVKPMGCWCSEISQ